MRKIQSLVAGLSLFTVGQTAAAQTDFERATAREAANNGRAAFDAGKFEKAVDYLSRAEQLVHSPAHLLFIARAQAKLGHLVAAHETYLKISRETLAPNAPKAFVTAHSAAEQEQETLSARLPSVTIVLRGPVKDNEVSVEMDGSALPAAMIGIPLPADPGEHVFKASGPNAISEPVTVKLSEAERQTVTLQVRSTGTTRVAPAVHSSPASAAPLAAQEPAVPASKSAPVGDGTNVDHANSQGNGLLIGSFVSFGVGAVGLGVGIYSLLKSSKTRDDATQLFNGCELKNAIGQCTDLPLQSRVESKDKDADRQRNVGVAGLIVGGVGVATGLTLLLLHTSENKQAARDAAPHITPVFGLGSLGLVGTF